MFDNIIFFGGIHGVGKTTICKKICSDIDLSFLSASELLKWDELNADSNNKKVGKILETQNRLINGLVNAVRRDVKYILDGHYCLLDSHGEIVDIPLETFKLINPVALNIVTGELGDIKNRLEKRDGKPYDLNLLKLMQEREVNHAKVLAQSLNRPLFFGTSTDYSPLIIAAQNIFLLR